MNKTMVTSESTFVVSYTSSINGDLYNETKSFLSEGPAREAFNDYKKDILATECDSMDFANIRDRTDSYELSTDDHQYLLGIRQNVLLDTIPKAKAIVNGNLTDVA